jgi:hypothetical protein
MGRGLESANLQERLHALAAFLPRLEQPDFEFGKWVNPATEEPGVIVMGYYDFSETAEAFVKMAYDAGWVLSDFDWSAWAQTAEAAGFRDSPDALAQATAEQLARLLTVVIRQDRFCDGAIASAYESGLLTGIVRRAGQLESEATMGQS